MENIYRDVQSAASAEKLIESVESDHGVLHRCSLNEHDPSVAKRFTPVTRKRHWSYLRLAKDLVLYALAIVGLFLIARHIVYGAWQVHGGHHIHHISQEHRGHQGHPEQQIIRRYCDCGNSTVEALSLGCKYDSLAAAWLPEHCRDEELTAEFETMGPGPNGNWIYWADSNHTQEVTLEEIAAMADDPSLRFHMSYDWHVSHCIFYWRKQYRSRFNGKTVEPRDDSEEHILHCGKVIAGNSWGTVAGVALNTNI